MQYNREQVFEAITAFVGDLYAVFQSSKPTPLALYQRMITHIQREKSTQGMDESINGFIEFFRVHEKNIIENKLDAIPRGTVISYGKSQKIFLEIQKYIYMSSNDVDTRDAIRKHLVTISTILEPDIKKLEVLDTQNAFGIPDDTKEGAFINDILKDAQNGVGGVETDDPTVAMASIFTNVVPKLVSGLQQGVGNGDLDIHKMFGYMQKAMASMTLPPAEVADQDGEKRQLEIEELRE